MCIYICDSVCVDIGGSEKEKRGGEREKLSERECMRVRFVVCVCNRQCVVYLVCVRVRV